MKSMLELYEVVEQEQNPATRNQILAKIEDLRHLISKGQDQLFVKNMPIHNHMMPKPLDMNQTV